jgi:hypothetical protein
MWCLKFVPPINLLLSGHLLAADGSFFYKSFVCLFFTLLYPYLRLTFYAHACDRYFRHLPLLPPSWCAALFRCDSLYLPVFLDVGFLHAKFITTG